MDAIVTRCCSTPAGLLRLGDYRGRLCLAEWQGIPGHAQAASVGRALRAPLIEGNTDLLELACAQLDEYFAGRRRSFALPVVTVGTPFRRAVWQALADVAYGTTATYAMLALSIGRPTAVRATAAAVGANPIQIIIPCHRIVRADGLDSGYAGGIAAKKALLALEAASAGR